MPELIDEIKTYRALDYVLKSIYVFLVNKYCHWPHQKALIVLYLRTGLWMFKKYKITRKNCFRYLKLMSPLNAAICTTISYTIWVEWYYLKNNYLTLRSKVKVPRRSLRYMTHRLMFMHPHTKYHWTIWKDKKVMVWTSFAKKKQKKRKKWKKKSG
jgi:hypothetical protein